MDTILGINEWREINKLEEFCSHLTIEISEILLDKFHDEEFIVETINNILAENNITEDDINMDILFNAMHYVFEEKISENEEVEYRIHPNIIEILKNEEEKKDPKDMKSSIKSHIKRNRGAYIGTAAGAIGGKAIGGVGAGIGAGVGNIIGRRIDKKRRKKNKEEGKPEDNYR